MGKFSVGGIFQGEFLVRELSGGGLRNTWDGHGSTHGPVIRSFSVALVSRLSGISKI